MVCTCTRSSTRATTLAWRGVAGSPFRTAERTPCGCCPNWNRPSASPSPIARPHLFSATPPTPCDRREGRATLTTSAPKTVEPSYRSGRSGPARLGDPAQPVAVPVGSVGDVDPGWDAAAVQLIEDLGAYSEQLFDLHWPVSE